jgi:nucleotide-binding universal stress UspA family protein
MNPIRSILVVIDGRMMHGRALQRASRLARMTGASLYLTMIAFDERIHVADADPEVLELARRAYLSERREWLRECALEVREDRVFADVVWSGDFAAAFTAKVLELKPDLVLKDMHH